MWGNSGFNDLHTTLKGGCMLIKAKGEKAGRLSLGHDIESVTVTWSPMPRAIQAVRCMVLSLEVLPFLNFSVHFVAVHL